MNLRTLTKTTALSSMFLVACKDTSIETPTIQKTITSIAKDTLNLSKKAPEIGTFRAISGFLTDEQYAQLKKSGVLPSNCKFIKEENADGNFTGDYEITYNFFGLRQGTQKLPAGFEIKRNIIGQTVVVPEGTTGLLIKND